MKRRFSLQFCERVLADKPVSLRALLRLLGMGHGPKVRLSEFKRFVTDLRSRSQSGKAS